MAAARRRRCGGRHLLRNYGLATDLRGTIWVVSLRCVSSFVSLIPFYLPLPFPRQRPWSNRNKWPRSKQPTRRRHNVVPLPSSTSTKLSSQPPNATNGHFCYVRVRACKMASALVKSQHCLCLCATKLTYVAGIQPIRFCLPQELRRSSQGSSVSDTVCLAGRGFCLACSSSWQGTRERKTVVATELDKLLLGHFFVASSLRVLFALWSEAKRILSFKGREARVPGTRGGFQVMVAKIKSTSSRVIPRTAH